MSLGVPGALWLLGALPVLVLLHLLRTRRQNLLISSVLLWHRAGQDLVARVPFRRLERTLLLLLQLLVVGLATLALAQPQIVLPNSASEALVLVLDTSVSMQATDVTPSRLEVAKRDALALVAETSGPVMVIEAGGHPRIALSFADPRSARRVLSALRPTDAPGRLAEAVGLALAQRPPTGLARIVVFTDHVATPVAGVTYRLIGTTARNLGIVGLHVEPVDDGAHFVLQVRNFGTSRERVPVAVSLDGRRVLERELDLGPLSQEGVSGFVRGTGLLRAELRVNDALAVDDVAYAIVGAPLPRVVMIGEPSRVLDQALMALPVQYAAARPISAEAISAADIVILNQTPPAVLPPGNYLLVGTTALNLPLTSGGIRPRPQILRWSPTHPVMRYVELDGVQIEQALALRPEAGEVLAEGEEPLIWGYEGEGIRAIVLAFALDRSDFPLRAGFPIFLTNALRWLADSEVIYHAGDTFIQSARGATQAILVDPTGSRSVLRANGGRFVIPSLDRVGVYTVEGAGRFRRFVVNPSPEGSAIGPVGSQQTAADALAGSARKTNVWPMVLGGALVVLLAEWGLWIRGLPRRELSRSRVRARP